MTDRLSPSRRRLFLGVTIALPWVLLVLLELGLRAARYGDDYPLFVPYRDDPRFLMPNEQVGRRYFRGAFVPTVHLDFFRARKTPRTLRIVFQGESSAAGFPYGHGGAPSRMLERRLQATFPDRDVEVVNTALTAVSSYVLLDQADEIIAQRPDAVLIYTGHNEYYGVFGVASTRAAGRGGTLPAYLALRRFRVVQLLENLLSKGEAAAVRSGEAANAPGTVMELMAGDRLVPLGSPRYERGLAQFRANLAALLERYRTAHIPVYVGTLVSNERDQPPMVSGHAPGADTATWRRRYDVAREALARDDSTGAERALADAVRIDSMAADAYYALGRLQDRRGRVPLARLAYGMAKERDELRFRAPEAMNAIIREEAARHGAIVVESQRAVERASPIGVPDHTLILEHLHPNLAGYFVIADAFYESLRAHGAFGAWPAPVSFADAWRSAPVTPLDSLAALYRTDRLTSGWPFRPRGVTLPSIADTLHPRTPLESLAQRLVNGKVSWAEATDRLRAEYERASDVDAAIRAANALAAEYRYSAQPYVDAARVALAARRYDEALRYARLAHARRETAETAEMAGLLTLRAGDQGGAVPLLQRAAELAPQDGTVRGALAAARMLPYLETDHRRTPRDTAVLYKLAVAYGLTQQYDRSRETLRALLAVAPRHAQGRELLERLPQ